MTWLQVYFANLTQCAVNRSAIVSASQMGQELGVTLGSKSSCVQRERWCKGPGGVGEMGDSCLARPSGLWQPVAQITSSFTFPVLAIHPCRGFTSPIPHLKRC